MTGVGALTSVGMSAPESWRAILAGKSGIVSDPALEALDLPSTLRGAVDHNSVVNHWLDPKTARNTSAFSLWMLEAAGEAMIDAGLIDGDLQPTIDFSAGGATIGTCVGGMYDDILPAYDTFTTRGADRISPHLHVKFPLNMAGYTVQWRFGLTGPSSTVSTACATGTQAIGEAFHVVASGHAPMMVAGATESTSNPLGTAGFAAMRALVTDSNDDPDAALRPFDASRAGFALGEGAGAVILEDLEFARARGATVYAEVLGFASSNDAYHPIAPNPEGSGAALAMRDALADAGLEPEDIGHIQAHAASTPAGDVAESKAIMLVYGERGAEIPVMSVKGAIGHCMGGAGAIESVMGMYSIAGQIIPPTRNFANRDPEIPLDVVHGAPRRHTFTAMAKHGFGLGGQNACLIIGKAPDELPEREIPADV
ncbi:MAG: beta-ketoacyl-[acyl-carrier-protein] synthase family protein [Thermomicrobiales bacterium]|nr:beta-ketoacyl-[acyl-carrier-protein] synthase family protein [Thermomicrobiales bacterium]